MEDATGVTEGKGEGRGAIDCGKGEMGRGMREGGNVCVGERELKGVRIDGRGCAYVTEVSEATPGDV